MSLGYEVQDNIERPKEEDNSNKIQYPCIIITYDMRNKDTIIREALLTTVAHALASRRSTEPTTQDITKHVEEEQKYFVYFRHIIDDTHIDMRLLGEAPPFYIETLIRLFEGVDLAAYVYLNGQILELKGDFLYTLIPPKQ